MTELYPFLESKEWNICICYSRGFWGDMVSHENQEFNEVESSVLELFRICSVAAVVSCRSILSSGGQSVLL